MSSNLFYIDRLSMTELKDLIQYIGIYDIVLHKSMGREYLLWHAKASITEAKRRSAIVSEVECDSFKRKRKSLSFSINVKNLSGKTITLDVSEDDTIDDVKAKFQDKVGHPPPEDFVFQGCKLLSSKPLRIRDYNIWKDSQLTCYPSPPALRPLPADINIDRKRLKLVNKD